MGRIRRQIKWRLPTSRQGQATIEFTFAMIVIIFLIYGMVQVFRWAGLDLAERRVAHDKLLTNESLTAEQQLNPEFYRSRKMNAVYHGNIVK